MLATALSITLAVAACGRATEEEINQALGITPTPTPSAAQIATATAAASATAAARAAAASTPGAAGEAALGNVSRGSLVFTTWCSGCHRPGGQGPDLLAPGGPGADVSYETLLPLVRAGTNHPVPPGAYATTQIGDNAVRDLAAYIRSRAAP